VSGSIHPQDKEKQIMKYEDYTKRTWKVIESEIAGCEAGKDHAVFTGPETNVTIRCGTEQYDGGMYVESSGMIEKKDDYTIAMDTSKSKYEITFKLTPKSPGSIGGSWTAEDHTPGPVA
jgi:hypothetical protein